MNRVISSLVLVALIGSLAASPLPPQHKRLSLHDSISYVISGDRVMIVYGRPHTIKPGTTDVRKIWGGLVPWGQVWRTGADEATLFITQQPIVIGGATIPSGCYSLWSLPNQDGTAQLIVNKQIGQWGEDMRDPKNVYDQANDVARVDMKKSDLDKSVEQFTMGITKDPDVSGGGLIVLQWETTQYSVAFTVAK